MTDNPKFTPKFGYWSRAVEPTRIYYKLEWDVPNGINGTLEIGNAYMKLNGETVATGSIYTGDTITLSQPFVLFNHFNTNWSNYIRSGHCGQVLFYESGVLAATFTPYLDDNGVAGFLDENNQTMIYSTRNSWVAGPPAISINISPESKTVKATGETFTIDVESKNDWTAIPTNGNWYTISPTGGTSADTAMTVTVPSYTGDTARQDTIVFTDTATTDSTTFTLKQKKYVNGNPFIVGDVEVYEAYVGDIPLGEAYLGEELMFSAGAGPVLPDNSAGGGNNGGYNDGGRYDPGYDEDL